MRLSSRLLVAAALTSALISTAETIDTSSGDIDRTTSITDGTLTKNGTGTLTLTGANSLSGDVTVNDGTLALSHAGALAGATTVIVKATNAVPFMPFPPTSIGGTLSVTGVSVIGDTTLQAGTYTITGANTLSPTTGPAITISSLPAKSGTLTLNTSVAGLNSVKLAGGVIDGPGSLEVATLNVSTGRVSATIAGHTAVIDETGLISLNPNGINSVPTVATFDAANTYSGGTTIAKGTLVAANARALGTGNITVNGTFGTAAADTTLTIPTSFHTPGVSASGNPDQGAVLTSGTILTTPNGAGGVVSNTKNGAGVLHLSSGNIYTGATTVSGGTLTLSTSGSAGTLTPPDTGTLSLASEVATAGDLTLNGGTLSGTGSLAARVFDVRAGDIAAKLTGSGLLIKSGAGTVRLSAVNDYTGGTTVSLGRLVATTTGALTGAVTVSGGLLSLEAGQNLSRLDVTSTGALDVRTGETRVAAGVLAGNIVVNSGATLTLEGAARIDQKADAHPYNVVTGTNGTEVLTTSVLLVNGSLNLIGNDHQLGLLAGSGNVTLTGGATYSFVASRFTGTITNTSAPETPGSSGSGDAPVSGGYMVTGLFQSSGNLQGPIAGRVMNLDGSALITPASDWSNHGTINVGSGIIFALGTTPHTVGANTVNIASGATLKGLGTITGSVVNHGVVAPGNSPGVITVGGDFTNAPGATLQIEIAGATPGTGYDVVRYAGSATITGSYLDVVLLNGYVPGTATAFRFLEDTDTATGSPSVIGDFAMKSLPPGLYSLLVTDTSGTTLYLSSTLAGMPGAIVPSELTATDNAVAANPATRTALANLYNTAGGAAASSALKSLAPVGLGALHGLAFDAARTDARDVIGRGDEQRALLASENDAWIAYAGYSGGFAESGSGNNATAYDHSLNGGKVGLERAVGDSLVLGLAPSYTYGRATFTGVGGRTDLDRAGLVAYTALASGDTMLHLGVKAAYDDFETRRDTLTGRNTGDTEGYEAGAFVALSQSWRTGDFAITPQLGVDYTYAYVSGYDEAGSASALRVKSLGQDSLRPRVGVAFDWFAISNSSGGLALGLDVGADHELLAHHADVRAAFGGSSYFTTASALNARTTVDIGPHIAWRVGAATLSVGYRYEDGLGEQSANRVNATYSYRF